METKKKEKEFFYLPKIKKYWNFCESWEAFANKAIVPVKVAKDLVPKKNAQVEVEVSD